MNRMVNARIVLLLTCLSLLALFADTALAEDKPWTIELKTKLLFNSHTSYEFGNPIYPENSPLSRLEFPLDSFWTGLEVRRQIGRVSLGVEFFSNIVSQNSGAMKDSDWDHDSGANKLTTLSYSSCQLNPSFQIGGDIDVQIADALDLPSAFDVRPLVGFSWQQLSFATSDLTQYEYDEHGHTISTTTSPGNGLLFDQDWYQGFIGLRLGYTFRQPPVVYPVKLYTQLDWRYVRGRNIDRHLLRLGNRITKENTTGDGWHAVVGVMLELSRNTKLKLEYEYLRMVTTGSHKLASDFYDTIVFTHGVKVWSEQRSINLSLEYHF